MLFVLSHIFLLRFLTILLSVSVAFYLWQFRNKWQPLYLTVGAVCGLVLLSIGFFAPDSDSDPYFSTLQILFLSLVIILVTHLIFRVLHAEQDRRFVEMEYQQNESAERSTRMLADALYQAGMAMTATLDFDQVLDVIVDQVERLVPYDAASILWIEGSQIRVSNLRGSGKFGAAYASSKEIIFEISPTSHLNKVIESQQPMFISDTHIHPGWTIMENSNWIRSWVGAPIIVKDYVVALLSLDKSEPNFYNSAYADRLGAFASQAALALGNSQLYKQVQEYTLQLENSNREAHLARLDAEARAVEAEMLRRASAAVAETLNHQESLKRILEQLSYVVPHDSSSVQLLQGDVFRLVDGRGLQEKLIGATFSIHSDVPNRLIYERRQPVIVNNVRTAYPNFIQPEQFEVQSWLGIPLMLHDKIVGMLTIDSKEENYFTDAHVRLATSFANQVVIALENAHLYQSTKRNAERLELMYQASQKFSHHLEREQLYTAIHDAVKSFVICDAFFITLVDRPQNEFENVYMFDNGRRAPSRRLPINTGVAGYAITNNESLKIDDLPTTDPSRFQNLLHFGDPNTMTRSIILALMRVGGVVNGALSVQSYSPYAYTNEDLEMLELLAANAAIAIENARYYNDALREVERRALLYEASQKMSDQLDLEQLYFAIYKAASRLITCQVFVISLLNTERDEVEHVFMFDRGEHWPVLRFKVGTGMIGYVISVGTSMRFNDLSAVDPSLFVMHRFGYSGNISEAALVSIMRRGEKIIGAISAQAYTKNTYTDADLKTLDLLTAHAAISIDNARYYHEALRDADRRTALYEASKRMSDKLDIEQLYLAIHESVARLMLCESFIITLINGKDHLNHVYLYDNGKRAPIETSTIDEGMIGYTISSGKSLRIDDLSNIDRNIFTPVLFGEISTPTQSAVVALMWRGHNIIGTISTQSISKFAYTDADLKMLELLAAHAAIVIDNVRLFAETQRYATIDELTSIYNRRYLMVHAQIEFDRAKKEDAVFSLIMFDVDFFKRINDGYGHLVGDQILRSICAVSSKHLRSVDTFGRFGGEEFIVLLPDTTLAGAQRIAERLRASIETVRVESKKGEVGVTVSFGVSELLTSLELLNERVRDTFTLDNLIDQSDQALYVAKRDGRNRVRVYPEDIK